ncbi:YtxH domain-containing protein [Ktedonosporobacter rubrisoli]|uniref:YtxH domain-containing protein n=1 Tax=Ktedonosporobacter rubrisoli TaxID=2509675 RepID=A0A4V0Z008_KTERU|nr:YtxH domain-containing protein [Ktedonosporobacter rubrisoli]QBD81571.1 YtxH domain-containing protein [Ktedonosporobacter rubrisoli]
MVTTIKELSKSGLDKAKDLRGKALDSAQDKYADAKDAAQSTYYNVQGNVQSQLNKVPGMLALGFGLLQGWLNYINKKSQLQQLREQAQSNASTGLARTQDLLGAGMDTAQVALEKSRKGAKKKLEKAQKNLHDVQDIVQDKVSYGLSKTQDTLGKRSQQASKSLQSAASSMKDLKDSVQDQYVSYQRKRKRAKFLFRVGLVSGVALALLYAPVTGAQTREWLKQQWQRARDYMGV